MGYNGTLRIHATFIITVIVLLHVKIVLNALPTAVSNPPCFVHDGNDLLRRLRAAWCCVCKPGDVGAHVFEPSILVEAPRWGTAWRWDFQHTSTIWSRLIRSAGLTDSSRRKKHLHGSDRLVCLSSTSSTEACGRWWDEMGCQHLGNAPHTCVRLATMLTATS